MLRLDHSYLFVNSVQLKPHIYIVRTDLLSTRTHVPKLSVNARYIQNVSNNVSIISYALQYTLGEATDNGSDPEDGDDMYTAAKHTDNRDKNRYDNILACKYTVNNIL